MKIIVTLIFILFSLLSASSPSENSNWSGEWHVSWKAGTFVLILEQNGTKVKGSYEPESGKLEGKVSQQILRANTQTSYGRRGKLTLTMGESHNTFFGTTHLGDWISGVRVAEDKYFNALTIDMATPLQTTYSFLSLGSAVRNGQYRALEKALDILNFTEEQKSLSHGVRLALAETLFSVMDQCIILKRDFAKAKHGEARQVIIKQLGSDVEVVLHFTKKPEGWKIDVPSQEHLSAELKALLKARNIYEVNPHDNLKLENARASMRTFIEQYQRWEEGGKDFVISTLNLSRIDPAIHEWQAPLLAFYLKSVLDRVSTIIYQELPNDPKSQKPYVHYYHDKGSIVLAPYSVGEKTIWQFSPDTLAHIDTLYYEMSAVQTGTQTKIIQENNLYFYLKDKAKSISPFLLYNVRHTEYWQIFMLILIVFLALFMAYLVKFFVMKGFKSFYLTKRWSVETVRLRYIRPMQIVVFALILLYGAHALGLSNLLFSMIKSFSHLLIVLGSTWISYNLVTIVFEILQIYAKRTSTNVDEIILSLSGSVVRIFVIVMAIFLVAEILKIPYRTVITGLGIGGLAFAIAAKDSISNFFGSAIIIADRPFKTGDRVKIGGTVGIISHVGIRSTKIRTLDDTLLTVPNNLITNEMIDNYSEREVMRIETEFFLSLDTSKEMLDSLDSDILTFLEENKDVESKKVILIGVNDFTNRGIVFAVSFYIKANTETRYSELRHSLLTELAQIIKEKEIKLIMLPKGLYTE
ncbi:MAG: mechanosensitive ion channel [Sulfurovum sp.]|nr:mechanosensitive ion channel [Sulfurovum sp.]